MASDVEALRREHYNAIVVGERRVHDGLLVLRVRPDAPIPRYDAGQWIALGTGLWEPRVAGLPPEELDRDACQQLVRRPFSISSPMLTADGARLLRPDEEDFYEFYLTLTRDAPSPPAIAARLFAFHPGSRLWIADHPKGQNTVMGVKPDDDLLFAATGTGEAPHNRMIWELLRRGHRGRIAAVVSTRRYADQAYRAVHERVMELYPNYGYVAIATREPGEPSRRLQDLLRSGELEERIGFRLDPARGRVFLCGNPGMIGAPRLVDGKFSYPQALGMVEVLQRERGFGVDPLDDDLNIHFERY